MFAPLQVTVSGWPSTADAGSSTAAITRSGSAGSTTSVAAGAIDALLASRAGSSSSIALSASTRTTKRRLPTCASGISRFSLRTTSSPAASGPMRQKVAISTSAPTASSAESETVSRHRPPAGIATGPALRTV